MNPGGCSKASILSYTTVLVKLHVNKDKKMEWKEKTPMPYIISNGNITLSRQNELKMTSKSRNHRFALVNVLI